MYPNTQTQLFLNPKKKIPWQGSDLSSLGRIMWVTTQTRLFLTLPPHFFPRENNYEKQGLSDPLILPKRWQIFPTGC